MLRLREDLLENLDVAKQTETGLVWKMARTIATTETIKTTNSCQLAGAAQQVGGGICTLVACGRRAGKRHRLALLRHALQRAVGAARSLEKGCFSCVTARRSFELLPRRLPGRA